MTNDAENVQAEPGRRALEDAFAVRKLSVVVAGPANVGKMLSAAGDEDEDDEDGETCKKSESSKHAISRRKRGWPRGA